MPEKTLIQRIEAAQAADPVDVHLLSNLLDEAVVHIGAQRRLMADAVAGLRSKAAVARNGHPTDPCKVLETLASELEREFNEL